MDDLSLCRTLHSLMDERWWETILALQVLASVLNHKRRLTAKSHEVSKVTNGLGNGAIFSYLFQAFSSGQQYSIQNCTVVAGWTVCWSWLWPSKILANERRRGWDLASVIDTLQWRHNERHGISRHWRLDCLLNRLFMRRAKKTSSPASLAFVRGIHRWPVNFHDKRPVTRKMFPFHYVIT